MARPSKGGIVPTFGKDVQLGWIYNSTLRECIPPDNLRKYRCTEHSSLECNISDVSKDYPDFDAEQIMMVHLEKKTEKRAEGNIDNPSNQEVVTSLFFKENVYVLLFYDVSVSEKFMSDLQTVIKTIYYGQNIVDLPKSISNGNKGLQIFYGNYKQDKPTETKNISYGLTAVCRYLKDMEMGKPLSVGINKVTCLQLQSKTQGGSIIKNSDDKPVHDSSCNAQVVAKDMNRTTTKNSILAETHSTTNSQNMNNDDKSLVKIRKVNQTKESKFQPKISSENGRPQNSQKAPKNENLGSRDSVSSPQTSQSSNSYCSQEAINNSKHPAMDTKLDDTVTMNGQNSNATVVQSTYFDKENNSDLEMNNNSSNPVSSVISNSVHLNKTDLSSSYMNENIAADTQELCNMSNSDQKSQYSGVSSGQSENSLNNNHSIVKMLKPSKIVMEPCGMKRHYYVDISPNIEDMVILLLGASGSGKTTLVNFVANFFHGVKTADDEKIIVALSSLKTKDITAYTFSSGKENDTTITIIDTPGLNDSSGSEIRDHINSLKIFLANTATHNLKIHAIGFVAQAHLVRLTSSERLVMDYVSTLFGEGVKDNIITLITFADVQESPPVVEAMENYGIKIKHFLKFNNAILNGSAVEVDDLDRVYWHIGYKSWKKGMKLLKDFSPLSINAMKSLQKEVYTTSIIESSLKDLNDGLIDFISIYNQGNLNEIHSSGHKVWDLVIITHYNLSHTSEVPTSLENLLVTRVETVCCQLKLQNSPIYLRALSFYSSRGLNECAKAILNSILPVYFSALHTQNAMTSKSNVKNNKRKCDTKNSFQSNIQGEEFLYCYGPKCNEYHKMQRLNEQWIVERIKKVIGYSNDAIITFKCKTCTCSGDLHGINPMIKSEGIKGNFGSDVKEILLHTKDMLFSVIKRYSLPNSDMKLKDLLRFLMKEDNAETNEFIGAILNIIN